MKHKGGSKKPSYNGQVAVDNKEQVIVAADLVDEENDLHQMDPMIQHIHSTLGYKPTIVLADAGYFSYDNIELLIQEGIDAYIPDNSFEVEKRGKAKWFMRSLFRYDEEKDCYYCPAGIVMPFERMSTVESVFGQMKQNRGFREFLLRGKKKAKVEFLMMCVVHNIGKIAEALKRGGTNLKEILENGIQGANQSGNDMNNVAMGA